MTTAIQAQQKSMSDGLSKLLGQQGGMAPGTAGAISDATLTETIYFKMKDEGSNILNKAAFDEIYDFDSKIRRDMEVKVDGEMWNFTDICAKVPAAYPARLPPPCCRADTPPTRQARPTDEFCLAGGSPRHCVGL